MARLVEEGWAGLVRVAAVKAAAILEAALVACTEAREGKAGVAQAGAVRVRVLVETWAAEEVTRRLCQDRHSLSQNHLRKRSPAHERNQRTKGRSS